MAKIDWSKVAHPTHEFFRFPSRRSVVYGTKGVVSCSQPLACEAGLEILRKGGNAADAAVAVSAALNITEPTCCGIGGDAFCLFYDATTKTVRAINGSGRSPKALTLELARSRGIGGRNIPLTDLNSVTVPGAAAAWVDTVSKFGSGKVTLGDVLGPAIRLAEEGVPVSEVNSHSWQRAESSLKRASPSYASMLHPSGHAPLPGQIMTFPDLARTFREVIAKGKDGFYKGRVAEAIVELIKSKGGVMELSDLEEHESEEVEPLVYEYKEEVKVYECPPNGQGITALIALGLLDALEESVRIGDILQMKHNSAEYLHVLVELLRLAFADSRYYVTDPNSTYVPVKELLSKEYLAERAKLFDPEKATADVRHGSPVQSSATVYFSVVDEQGNGCSFIQSNYAGFGTGAIPQGCGFTLQNRGTGFVLEEGHPNMLKPGKRPYHTIIPALATRGDDLFLVFGVMGGFMQPQGQVQVLLNILRGFTPQAALDAPRFCISAGLPDAEVRGASQASAGDINSEVYFEDGITDEVIEQLRGMGHDAIKVVGAGRSLFGRGQIIEKLWTEERTVWAAGSDPRADGHAVAQI